MFLLGHFFEPFMFSLSDVVCFELFIFVLAIHQICQWFNFGFNCYNFKYTFDVLVPGQFI